MKNFELVYPNIEYKEEILAMLEEIKKVDAGTRWQYSGMSSLEEYSNYEEWIEKVLVTCDTENIGSAKTIEKCQGQLENIVPKENYFTKRYWIYNK